MTVFVWLKLFCPSQCPGFGYRSNIITGLHRFLLWTGDERHLINNKPKHNKARKLQNDSVYGPVWEATTAAIVKRLEGKHCFIRFRWWRTRPSGTVYCRQAVRHKGSLEVWIWQVPGHQLRGSGGGALWCHRRQRTMGTCLPGWQNGSPGSK